MPEPKPGESRNEFVGRCMEEMYAENRTMPAAKRRGRAQMLAICESKYDEMRKGKGMMND